MFSGDFRRHPDLEGRHAFLSASKYSWLRYTDEKLVETFNNAMNAQLGTELHELAHRLIRLGVKLPASRKTLNMYVNDSIGWRMKSEVVLAYSENIFGTADAIDFGKLPRSQIYDEFRDASKFLLRISDLKNGVTPTKIDQLLIYAALFFLEYGVKPGETLIELRIYQNDDVELYLPDTVEIVEIMDRIKRFDDLIENLKKSA